MTVLPGPPTIYQSMLDHPDRAADLSRLRLAVTGAARVPPALVERMQRRTEVRDGAHGVRADRGGRGHHVPARRRPGDGRVARPAGPPPGSRSEIASTSTVPRGNRRDPAARAERDARVPRRTGRHGRGGRRRRLAAHRRRRAPGRRGYLPITDRLKDMYICGGFNVYPAEVEQVLARLPEVAESVVVGVPDGRLGEVGQGVHRAAPGPHPVHSGCVATAAPAANYKVPSQVFDRRSNSAATRSRSRP